MRANSVPHWYRGAHDTGKKCLIGSTAIRLPYGLNELNRMVVGTLARFLREQRLIERRPDLDPLFIVPRGS